MSNTLYSISIVEFSDTTLEAKVDLADWHPLYEGHFPGAPVLPGVIQLQLVREVLQLHFGRKLSMKQTRTCKFLGVINPLIIRELTLNLKWQRGENLEVIANIQGDMVFMKAQLSYVLEN